MDPYARGAYSYSLVGGAAAAAKFARGVEDTLWFAGEAADAEGRNGTVNGAIGSGRAAAKAVQNALALLPTTSPPRPETSDFVS